MVIFPTPKINIGLFIVAESADGYHDIETIFYPLRQPHDVLEIERADEGIDFEVTNCSFDVRGENICVKAFRLLKERCGFGGGLKMRLTKNIPAGAGLGGGSADAAATINGINDLYDLHLDSEQMKRFAFELGSDVPFFIDGKPAFATHRGEIMTPIDLDLEGKKISLVVPPFSMSTAEAYGLVKSRTVPFDLRMLPQIPVARWKDFVGNDFEEVLFNKFPRLGDAKKELYSLGADFVLLTGSGSVIYAIGDEEYTLSDGFFDC